MHPERIEIEVRVTDDGIHHAVDRSLYAWGGGVRLVAGSAASSPFLARAAATRRYRELRRAGLAASWVCRRP